MADMTPEAVVAELTALTEATMPLPWTVDVGSPWVTDKDGEAVGSTFTHPDAALIVRAVNLTPAVIGLIEAVPGALRQMHTPFEIEAPTEDRTTVEHYCRECGEDWPCPTARLRAALGAVCAGSHDARSATSRTDVSHGSD